MKTLHFCPAALLLLSCVLPHGGWANNDPSHPEGWKLAFEDHFEREAVGMDWDIVRGEWRIEKGRLVHAARWETQWVIRTARPLAGNVRLECDLEISKEGGGAIALKIGDQWWDGGGRGHQDGDRDGCFRFCTVGAKEIILKGSDFKAMIPGRTHRIEAEYVDGTLRFLVDGKLAKESKAALDARFNDHVAFSVQDVAIDNVRIHTRPHGAAHAAALPSAMPETNRKATVDASRFLDPSKVDCGFQAAIDSLPPTGGAVILPKGEFVLRQPLFLRDGVALRGQGRATTLALPSPIVWTRLAQDAQETDQSVTVEKADGFVPGMVLDFGGADGMYYLMNTPPWRVERVEGRLIHLNKPLGQKMAAKTVVGNFFPMIFGSNGSDMEVRDLDINGRGADPAPFKGGYGASAVSFFFVREVRVDNVHVDGWKGDAFSFQGGRDNSCTRCKTSKAAHMGYHPGSCQRRMILSRCVAEDSGDDNFYFCRYNKLSAFNFNIFNRSAKGMMGGLAGAGDCFNTAVGNYGEGNRQGMPIEKGCDDVIYGNVLVDTGEKCILPIAAGKITENQGTWYPWSGIPRYHVIASNTFMDRRADADPLKIVGQMEQKDAKGNVVVVADQDQAPANVIAANRYWIARARPDEKLFDMPGQQNVVADNRALEPSYQPPIPGEILKTIPDLPFPITDAGAFYKPDAADCGFQAALDEAGKKGGGTVHLPAGHYPLARSLVLPSGVTLRGEGLGTLLLPRPGVTAIKSANTRNIAIRQLCVRDANPNHETLAANHKGVLLENVERFLLADVRVERMATGFALEGGSGGEVVFCKAFLCGDGLNAVKVNSLDVSESHFLNCVRGVVGESLVGTVRMLGNVIWFSRESGLRMTRPPPGLQCLGNVIGESGVNGVALGEAEKAEICGNVILNASRSVPGEGAGVCLDACTGSLVQGNRIGDDTYDPMMLTAVRETGASDRNRICFNACAPHFLPRSGRTLDRQIQAVGKGTVARDNVLRPYPETSR